MKKYNVIVFIGFICILTFMGCNSPTKKSTEEDIETIVVGYQETEFNLYEVKPSLYHLLDSVIESVNKCQLLKNEKFIYCFSVNVNDSLTEISIELRNPKDLYCADIDGVFIYQNSIFEYNGNFLYDFLVFKNKKIKYKCRRTDVFMHDINDEQLASWNYILKGKTIKCIGYSICKNFWADENYYKAEN